MGKRTVVSTIFWPWNVGNLSVVSIISLNGKSNRCFNNILAFHCKQSIRRSNFSQIGNQTVVSTIFGIAL